jgi:NTP pyrophosphatase (non-canonical NTP hydrolase)
MTINQAQQEVDSWIKKHGIRYFSEMTNIAMLMEEVGELARLFARKFGDQVAKLAEKDNKIEDEIADVLFVLICLANQTGVDLTEAFKQNLVKKTDRDANRHRNNPKLRQ